MECGVQGSEVEFGVQDLDIGAWGSGFRVQGKH